MNRKRTSSSLVGRCHCGRDGLLQIGVLNYDDTAIRRRSYCWYHIRDAIDLLVFLNDPITAKRSAER